MLKQKVLTFFMTQLFNFLEMVKTGRAGNFSDINILTYERNWDCKVSACSTVSYSTALDFTWLLILFSIYKVCCSAESPGLMNCSGRKILTEWAPVIMTGWKLKSQCPGKNLQRDGKEKQAAVLGCEHLLCTWKTTSASTSTSFWKIFPRIDTTLATKKDVHLQEQDIVVKRGAGKMSEAWKA